MSDSAPIRIRILGRLGASAGDVELDLGGRRQRAVLAVLLIARGEVVTAERLADSVWAGDLPANAAGAVQSYVSHLRRRLEPGGAPRARARVIVSEGNGYAVRLPPDAVDAWTFERLVRRAAGEGVPHRAEALLIQALELWRGPALGEYTDQAWAEAEIARLSELRAVARERLAAARLDGGEDALLVPELETLVAEEPLREERWRLLVLALYRAHRQGDALAALRRARDHLARELGIDPGPALRTLEAEVLGQSPALAGPGPGTIAPSTTPPTPSTPGPGELRPPAQTLPPSAPPGTLRAGPRPAASPAPAALVDRDGEVAAVRRAVADLGAGGSRLVLIEGPAGVGKTCLLAEARRAAEEHALAVFSARGSQLERTFGFGAVRQLFEPVLSDPARRHRLLDGAAAGARAVFDLLDNPVEGSFAALHGLYWLTAWLAAERPLVLVIDDLQWTDA
ncbi:MAG TPA: BTAD domain-containing putative transcriptional regulator, partial [Kineosporiaceae bacterium]|nr:BTAD domain-containing putative transcriptional regulator [Kineosporiaceae bacterium]